jgi:hypothetical protein
MKRRTVCAVGPSSRIRPARADRALRPGLESGFAKLQHSLSDCRPTNKGGIRPALISQAQTASKALQMDSWLTAEGSWRCRRAL